MILLNSLTRTQQILLLLLAGVAIVVASLLYWNYLAAPRGAVIELPPDTLADPSQNKSGTEPSATAELVVHVAGAVQRSGVYRLTVGSRVIDAVEAAGGATDEAELDALNLAEPLVDGRKVWVPKQGEVQPMTAAGILNSAAAGVSGGKVNINTADLRELETLPRIGPALAQRIIDYRTANGPFQIIEDIKKVSGIGEKIFEGLKDYITTH